MEITARLTAKKHFITCHECDEKVPLMDFVEQRLKSDPVARKIQAMDETGTRNEALAGVSTFSMMRMTMCSASAPPVPGAIRLEGLSIHARGN